MPFGSFETPLETPIYHVCSSLNEVLRKTRDDAECLTRRPYAVIGTSKGYFLRTPGKADVRIDVKTDARSIQPSIQPLFLARVDKWMLFVDMPNSRRRVRSRRSKRS